MKPFHLLLCALLVVSLALILPLVSAGADYYATLGVPRSATADEIKKAYRELSKKYHPDKNPGDKVAEQKFVAIAAAHDVLGDEQKRRIYDQHGEEGLKQQMQQQNNPFQQNFVRKGPNINMDIEVTLEDLYLGTSIEVICDHCRGSGARSEKDVETCKVCGGRGMQQVKVQVAPGFFMQQEQPCNACKGKGKTIKVKCPVCGGNKVKRGENLLTMYVERGMSDGQQLVFSEQGDQTPDLTPGDLIITLRQLPHPSFSREGNNLYIKQLLTLQEALLGFRKVIKHLDGKEVVLERTKVTQPGFVDTISGQGMPLNNFPSQKGDLYVEYSVLFPTTLSAAQKELVKQLLG